MHSLPGETSDLLAATVVNTVHEYELNFENFTAFCADNTNTNFGGPSRGGTKNVFAKLKDHKADLIGIGCFAHIVHNCASSAADFLSIDFEQFALKVCSYFNGQNFRHEALKGFCEFVQTEYRSLPKHGATRWLSLLHLVDRLLQLWFALKSFFNSIDRPPKAIMQILSDARAEMGWNAGYFWQNALSLFNNANLQLQRSDLTLHELYGILEVLRKQLNARLNCRHFGVTAQALLNEYQTEEKSKSDSLRNELIDFYQGSIQYMDKWTSSFQTDFTKEMLEWMCLSSTDDKPDIAQIVSFDSVLLSAQRFCPEIARKEQFFDEVVELNETLWRIMKNEKDHFTNLSVSKKWEVILRNMNIPLIARLIDTVFCMPCLNAFCERVFSLMNIQWTDERNSLDLSSVSAILCVLINSDNMKCEDVVEFLHAEDKIYDVLKSTDKYNA